MVNSQGVMLRKNSVPCVISGSTEGLIGICENWCPVYLSFACCLLYSYLLSLDIDMLLRLIRLKECASDKT